MIEVSLYEGNGLVRRELWNSDISLYRARLVTAQFEIDDPVQMNEVHDLRNRLISKDFSSEEFLSSPRLYLIGHKNFYFYPPEKRSAKSSTSQAIYVARSADKKDGLLLQFLPPNSHTSKHYHKLKTETYHVLEGTAFLEVDGQSIELRHSAHIVFPNKVHTVYTKEEPALTLLLIQNDPEGLSMSDHNYV